MDIVDVKIDQIDHNNGQIEGLPKNPRFIKDNKFDLLVDSLRSIPDMVSARPCIVYPFGNRFVCLAGNMRLRAAKKLNWDVIKCAVLDKETTVKQLREITIKDNSSYGENDWELLSNEWELDELLDWGVDVPDMPNESNCADIIDDEIGDTSSDLCVDIGDVVDFVKDGVVLHRLLCGDAQDEQSYKKLMGGELADLYITDPPYGVSYSDKNKFLNQADKGNRIQKPIENDHLSVKDSAALWLQVFENASKYMQNISSYYIFSAQGGDLMMMMMMMIDKVFQLKHCLIWVKNNHVLGRCDYNYKHEPILFGWKKGGTHKFLGGFKTSVLEFDKPLKSDLHPTMKPVGLICELVTNSSNEGDLILDTFAGSGTSFVACHKTNRRCFGIEIDAKYCSVIINRMIEIDGEITIMKNGEKWDISPF